MLGTLTPTTKTDVLVDIAIHGAEIAFKISKRTNTKKSTTYDALYKLEEKGLIESKELKKIGGRIGEKEYSLTLVGLVHVLWWRLLFEKGESTTSAQGKFETLIDHWSYLLPLIFEKWSLFKKHHVAEVAITSLLEAYMFLEHEDPEEPTDTYYAGVTAADVHRAFYRISIHRVNRQFSDYQDRWMEVCRKDEEIRMYLTDILEGERNYKYFEIAELWHNLQLLQKED